MPRFSAVCTAVFSFVAVIGACTPLSGPSTGPAPQAETLSPARQAVVDANAELVRRLAEGRAADAWALFTDEGALMAPGQRLVAGEDALREYAGGGEYELSGVRLDGVEVETCRDQALVRGTLSRPAGAGTGPGSWRYAAIWRREGAAGWRATMAVLDGPEMERRSLGRGCAPASKLARRWIVTGYVYPFVQGHGGAPRGVKDALVEQRFSSSRRRDFAPRSEVDPGDFMVDVRSRLRPPFGVEALYSRTPRHYLPGVQKVGATSFRHVAATLNTEFAAAAVFYEVSLLRVGAGPALSRTRWRWESDDNIVGVDWRTTDPGLLLLGGMSLPFGSRIIADVQGQLRLLPDAELPAFHTFSATTVRQSSVVVSVGFGIGL
jgi:hypothetical protein